MKEQVNTSGGNITVTEPGSPLTGLEINIPPDSYNGTLQFTVSYAPVKNHTFGSMVNPLSPMINIDNGGGYSNEFISVKVPVTIPAGHFAMGFLYDFNTKKLEGMPLVTEDANSITVATRHFSWFFISSINELWLKKDIKTNFVPGQDDWQFKNYGSYLAKGGHCTGQSMTSMWYYEVKPDGRDKTLFNRYDNNGREPATPKLWQDDSYGYRLCSVVWDEMDWDSLGRKITEESAAISDELTWNLFACAMQLTGQPQMTEVWNTKVGGGHAMVVYRIYEGNLYIADPNYPKDPTRRIEYKNGAFSTYYSGSNAYDKITYVKKTSLTDWNSLSAHWAELKNGTIGDDRFPSYRIVGIDYNGQNYELNDGYVSRDKLISLKVILTTPIDYGSLIISVFQDGNWLEGDAIVNIELSSRKNKLGIYVQDKYLDIDKYGNRFFNKKYVDFKYFNVFYNDSPTETPDVTSLVTINSLTATPAGVKRLPDGRSVYTFDVRATGTASGSVGAFMDVQLSNLYGVIPGQQIQASSWTPSNNTKFIRSKGNPASTGWTAVFQVSLLEIDFEEAGLLQLSATVWQQTAVLSAESHKSLTLQRP